jgi:hypothetical protein
MHRVVIILLCLLTACRAPGIINYADQPTAGTVPPPIGKWTRTPTLAVDDTVVYLPDDVAGPLPSQYPAAISGLGYPIAATFCQRVRDEISPQITYNCPPNADIWQADIPIRYYYGPHKSTSSMHDDLLAWLIALGIAVAIADQLADDALIGDDTVILPLDSTDTSTGLTVINGLHTSPPPASNEYNGVCYFTRSGDAIRSTSVWINVAGIETWPVESRIQYLRIIMYHELGHALIGLNDNTMVDDIACYEGLMSYCYMTPWFSDDEIATARWLYGD